MAVVLAGAVGALVSGGAVAGPASASGTATAVTAGAVPGPVLLIGTSGVRWSDVSAQVTPALWRLSRTAGVAVASTRGVEPTGCPVDGWLTVSAGTKAAAVRAGGTCAALDEPVDGAAPGWAADRTALASQQYDAKAGTLGEVLRGAGVSAVAVGPGAVVALAGADGRVVGRYQAVPSSAQQVTGVVRDALGSARVVVVDAGAVRAGSADGSPPAGARSAQLTAVDSVVGAALDAADPGTTVLVASLTDAGSPDLQLVAATGPAPDGGLYDSALLRSGATRQTGLVQTADVPATVLAALGARDRGAGLVGSTIGHVSGPSTADARLARLLDVQREALTITRVSGTFNTALLIVVVLFVVVAVLLLRGGRRPSRQVLRALQLAGTVVALLPVASFLVALVPWWRSGAPGAALGAAALGWAVLLAVLAVVGPWRRTVLGTAATVAAVTAGVLLADAVLGSPLTVDTPMGGHRLLGARFYGWSNQAFALAATAGMVLAVVVADLLVRRGRRWAGVTAVAVLGLVVVVVDGTPGLGSDAGGPVALLLMFGLLAVVVSGRRVRWRTVLLGLGAGVLVVGTLMVLDYLRPPAERTHLGRFVATLLQGGLWTVIARKESANLHVLGDWRVLALLVGAVALGWLALVRHAGRRGRRLRDTDLGGLVPRVPLLRAGLAAWGAAMAVGFLMNDSGIIIPATGIALLAPLLLGAVARLRDEDQGERARDVRAADPGPVASG
ncbi:hypothetical protein CELD12_31610 [Cellulomonas sp. NTE-D12]|nr:hypothetical protein CELD12_31610 [Cellulomonas sp. NTE-D12]